MTQTAVEWLIEQYLKDDFFKTGVYKQALEMERKQKIDFAIDFAIEFAKEYIGFTSVCTDANDCGPAERYYNQKYKTKTA